MKTVRNLSARWNIGNLDSPLTTVLLACLVAILCYQGDRLAYVLGIPPDQIASYWPPTPLLIAVLLLTPKRMWAVLIAAGLGAMAVADLRNGVPIRFEIWITFGNIVDVFVATLGIYLLFNGPPHLTSVKALAKYLVVGVLFAPLCSALVGAFGSVPGGYWVQWRLWLFADALAFLTLTPAILTWVREGRAWARKPGNYLELAGLMSLLVLFGYLAFAATGQREQPALLYSLVPLLLWAALRLGLKGVTTSAVVVVLLSSWGAAHGRGPFAQQGALNSVLSLQLFLFFAAMPFMFLAVLVEERKRAKEILLQSEERFRSAVEAGKMFAYDWDLATDSIVRSAESARILGIDNATPVTGQRLLAMVLEDDREILNAAIAKLSSEQPHLQISLRMVSPEGRMIWVENNSRAYFDERGRIVRLIGMVADISERKLAERELALVNERLRLAMESGKSVGWDREVKTGRDTLFGDLQSIYGIASEVFDGRVEDFHSYLHPEDRGAVLGAIDAAMHAQKPFKAEFRILRPDGSMIWIAAKGKFHYSPEGEPERMLGMAVDITERKLMEESLRESEERLRLAVQAGKMYAFEWDAATDMVIRSAEITHIPGLMGESVRINKQQFLAGVHPEDRAMLKASIAEFTPESPNKQVTFRLLRPDGSVRWLQRAGHAFFDEQGMVVRIIGVVADVTERKLAEEALSALSGRLIEAQEKERRRIARELHDDIGQRLALLAVNLQSLADIAPDSPAQIHDQSEQLFKDTLEISNDIQALSHELHSSKLEFQGLVSAMKGFCHEFGAQQKVKINFAASNVPQELTGEVSLCLFRIAQEGLRNAVKYSGVREFEVEMRGFSGEIVLIVRDSGVGFDPEAALSNRGIGIVSMRERVALVGGTISIASKPNGGTEIRVSVPLAVRTGTNQMSKSA